MIRKAMIALLLLGVAVMANANGCASGPEFPDGITGLVFEDTNANGVQAIDTPWFNLADTVGLEREANVWSWGSS